MSTEDYEVRRACTRQLSGPRKRTDKEWLLDLAQLGEAEALTDQYGNGPIIGQLEEEVATLLDKDAALMGITGTALQLAVLRTWTKRSGKRTVAIHQQSHLDADEAAAYQTLYGLEPVRLSDVDRHFTAADLDNVAQPLGVVTVELPLRNAGFLLPQWEELKAISRWCRRKTVPLHFDGARLWEASIAYGRSTAELADLADSVYVSLYKGLGGLGGAVLTCDDPAVLDEAQGWVKQQGGNVRSLSTYALAGLSGLRQNLPKIAEYHHYAADLTASLSEIDGVSVHHGEPPTNGFRVLFAGAAEDLQRAHREVAHETKVWLFTDFKPDTSPHQCRTDVEIGGAALEIDLLEISSFTKDMMRRAAAIASGRPAMPRPQSREPAGPMSYQRRFFRR